MKSTLISFSLGILILFGGTSCGEKSPADYTMYIQIDDWTHEYDPGEDKEFSVIITNKMEQGYKGIVSLKILMKDSLITENQKEIEIAKLKELTTPIEITLPEEEGTYEVVAEIVAPDGHTVKSRRIVEVDKPIVLDSLDISDL